MALSPYLAGHIICLTTRIELNKAHNNQSLKITLICLKNVRPCSSMLKIKSPNPKATRTT